MTKEDHHLTNKHKPFLLHISVPLCVEVHGACSMVCVWLWLYAQSISCKFIMKNKKKQRRRIIHTEKQIQRAKKNDTKF